MNTVKVVDVLKLDSTMFLMFKHDTNSKIEYDRHKLLQLHVYTNNFSIVILSKEFQLSEKAVFRVLWNLW